MSSAETTVGAAVLEQRPINLQPAMRQLSDRLVRQRKAVRAADWNRVLTASLDAIGAGRAHALPIASLEAESTATTELYLQYAEPFAGAFRALAGRPDAAAIAASARTELKALDPALARRMKDVLDAIEQGDVDFPGFVTAGRDSLRSAPTDPPADLAVAAISRGLRGMAHQAFNTASEFPGDLSSHGAVFDAFSTLIDQRESQLRDAQSRLFNAAKANASSTELIAEAEHLAATVEQFILGFAAAQARVAGMVGSLLAAGRGTHAERLGMRLATAGLLTREAFTSHAAALALGFELRKVSPSPDAQEVIDIGPGVSFDRALPSGVRTELADVLNKPEGTLVAVRGFATGFKQRRTGDRKLVSTVTLTDPSSGSSVKVAALFVHLPHAGVTEGAYVDAHGFVRASSELLEGEAGIDIDDMPLVQLAERSWRLRLLRVGARWAETWRNGLHVNWSLGKHSAAPDRSPAANRGAGELVFTPFVRERS